MLANFFDLNPSTPANHDIVDQAEFESRLALSNGLRNCLYKPNELKSTGNRQLKITNATFSNFSFKRTLIEDVMFVDCIFEDCLFMGVHLKNCRFHNCKFSHVNTHQIVIENTYINPSSFKESIPKYSFANIAVHLFQQLLKNSREQGQSSFARTAEYHFKKWYNRLTYGKFRHKKPYAIGLWRFLKSYVPNWIFRWTFGYGLRFRNFMATFLIVFSSFFVINYLNWTNYELQTKDMKINAFQSDSVNLTSNFFYTLDVTTKVVDSQFQPTSNSGMVWLSIQSICAFFLLSALVTLIANRFVK